MTTLILPIVSLTLFVSVALLTQKKPKHEAMNHRPTDQELISGAY